MASLPVGDIVALLLDLLNLGHSLSHVQGGLDISSHADPVHLPLLLGQQLRHRLGPLPVTVNRPPEVDLVPANYAFL